MEFLPIVTPERTFAVSIVESDNRNAYARVRDGAVVISIPRRMRRGDAEKVAGSLYSRISKGIASNPNRYIERKEIRFANGDEIAVLGRRYLVSIMEDGNARARARLNGGTISISLPAMWDVRKKDRAASMMCRRILTKAAMPAISDRLGMLNEASFNSDIGRIRVAMASTRWGSCSARRGKPASIMLNFRLLLMPIECLDYVMVHELAHTKVRGHSRRFWELVERAMPDYKERRRTLRSSR